MRGRVSRQTRSFLAVTLEDDMPDGSAADGRGVQPGADDGWNRRDEWKRRPEASENYWLDGLVGCAVAASIQGAVLPGTDMRQKVARKPVRLSDLQKRVQWNGEKRN